MYPKKHILEEVCRVYLAHAVTKKLGCQLVQKEMQIIYMDGLWFSFQPMVYVNMW